MFARHEEYKQMPQGIPFYYNPNIVRTATVRSTESNWHEDLEIQLCTKGEGYLLLDAERHPFGLNDVAVINSNVVHYTGTESSITYDCIILDAAFCREAGFELSSLTFEIRFQSSAILRLFEDVRRIYNDAVDVCRTAKLRMAALSFLIELRQNHTSRVGEDHTQNLSLKAVKNAIAFMREHYTEKLTLERIAAHVLIDKYTLTRHFKRITGSSVFGYLIGYRCKQAQAFIANGMRVSEAAYTCGFSNMSYFTKTFYERTGKLPSEYKPKK